MQLFQVKKWKIAFDQNVNSYGDAKKQIIEAVVKNASGLTLNEAYTYVKFSENDFKSLQYGNSTSDWYKEKTITVSGPFKQDLKVNISRYNSQVPENLSVSVATQVSQTNITDTNKINEIVNDVNKKIGPNLEVVNPPVSIDLTNSTSATFSIKSKDGLNIPTQIQKSINVTFTNLKLPEVTASLKDTSFNDGAFVGETVVYDLEGVETPKGTIENANYEGTITGKQLSVTFKKAGRQTISIKDANFDLKTKLTVNVLENKISAKGFNGSLNIRNEKSKTFQVDNYKLFNTVQIQSATFKDGETAQISSYSQSYDKETGKLTITGNGAGEVVNVQLSGQTVRGTSLTSDKVALQVSIPKQMPLWIIILLVVLLVLLLSVGGYFIWWKFFRSEFQKRQPRYAAIAADKHAVSKAKKTETAKLKKDKGIVRSGLFERELEYNLDKLNDPDYESKYVWINEGRVEDMDPVLNNWDDKKLGSKKPSNKKDPQLESRLQNVKKSVKK
ncbi:hypothetical protein [Spiroplasma endosymbiont of Diplazon laetatorius]|uniref:hypothetical protein n=1 Tax=Spiroplasma endosymbiont of Diplazon laetatorius TaxID=3066322 RepID=UPI0030CD4B9E